MYGRFWWKLTISLLPALLIGCDRNLPDSVEADSMAHQDDKAGLEPGVHDKSLALSSGGNLRYTIAVPSSYDSAAPTPLIVALHFGGQVTPHYARSMVEALVLPGLSELNAIIVAPDSIAGPWTNDKNEQAVLELMDYVMDQHSIDRERVLLTGFSMGGHGTWYIGSRNQDRFSAMIPISGAPMVDESVVWSTPVYIIHSRADDVVPLGPTEKYLAKLDQQAASLVELHVVEDLPHFQTPRFAGPLKFAVPWVNKIWESQ